MAQGAKGKDKMTKGFKTEQLLLLMNKSIYAFKKVIPVGRVSYNYMGNQNKRKSVCNNIAQFGKKSFLKYLLYENKI